MSTGKQKRAVAALYLWCSFVLYPDTKKGPTKGPFSLLFVDRRALLNRHFGVFHDDRIAVTGSKILFQDQLALDNYNVAHGRGTL